MLPLKALDRKVLRDAWRMRGQLLAIALVIACGVGVFLGMRATLQSLEFARSSYYAHERFGDVFAGLVRAPEHVARDLRAIPGVQRLQTRVVADVTLDVPGLVEAATGRLVSLPERGRPQVNDLRLRSGRMPSHERPDEVLVSEAFAEAHDFALGARLSALLNDRVRELTLVGVALSPEYTYAVAPGQLFPDNRLFGVLWMGRKGLATAFDMDGAFNDVSLRLSRDADVDEVLRRVDAILERYGGRTAIERKDQTSAFFLESDLTQLRTFGFMLPMLFLVVAAFLLNVVVGRIVAGQREEIAAMKALGYRDREVGWHFAKLVGVVTGVGCLLGVLVAASLGIWMTRMYAEYYRFPELAFHMGAREAVEGIALSLLAAGLGTWSAIRRTVALPPAEALRPAAPAFYRATLLSRLGIEHVLPTSARVVLRELERRPGRALFSTIGIALAAGLTVFNSFSFDSVQHILNVQFGLNQREDMQVAFSQPRATGALSELEHLPGVLHAEPFRNVPVRMSSGRREKTTAITGVPGGVTLMAVLDEDLSDVSIPPKGLVVSRRLAQTLGIGAGDTVHVEVLEGARREFDARVARVAQSFMGVGAHMDLTALCRSLGEADNMTGAWLTVDDERMADLHQAVKATPVVAGVSSRDGVLRSVREMLDGYLLSWVTVSLSFSFVMAFGVLYNAVRITLSERARDLASLRVLGYRRKEVAAILLGEIGLLVLVATPLGLLLGYGMAALMVASPGFDTDQFRLPLVVAPRTYATAVLTVLVAAVVSGWTAWRQLDRVDLVDVLKARD